jgi:serine protease
MKKLQFSAFTLTLGLVLSLVGAANLSSAQTRPNELATGSKPIGFIVKYREGVSPIAPNGEPTGENYAGVQLNTPRELGMGYTALSFESSVSASASQNALRALARDPRIESVQFDTQLNFQAASTVAADARMVSPLRALKPASAPTSLKASNYFDPKSSRQPRVRLSWKAPKALNKAKIYGYRIETSTNKTKWTSVVSNTAKTSTAFTVTTSIEIAKNSYFRVRALTRLSKSTAISAPSGVVSVIPKVAPLAPVLTSATVIKAGEPVVWAQQTANQKGGLSVTYEAVVQANGSEVASCETTSTSCSFVGLQANREYAVHVVARNSLGQSSTLRVNDPYYSSQWHLYSQYSVHADQAWRLTRGKSSIVVAVLDGGITEHPDLDGNILPGYDFISNASFSRDGNGWDSNPSDPGDYKNDAPSSWHGTHVAGIIAARANSQGGVGVAPGVKVQPIRVLGTNGGASSDLIAAIHWAAGLVVPGVPTNPTPARVINLSIGTSTATLCDAATQAAVQAAWDSGATPITAAGNSSMQAAGSYPGNCYPTINVTATGYTGDIAGYANFGWGVDFSAPGGDSELASESSSGSEGMIVSTFNLGETSAAEPTYGLQEGTSMAAPVVAGVVALIYSLRPELGSEDVYKILLATASDFKPGTLCATTASAYADSNANNPSHCGAGIIDAGSALARAKTYKR